MKTEALQSTKTARTTLPMPQHHIPEDSNPQQLHHSFNSALYKAYLTLQTKTKEEKDCAKHCSHHLILLAKLPFNSTNAVYLH